MSRSAQWVIFGATMLMAAPSTLVLAAQVWAHADKTPAIIELHAWFARFGSVLAIFLQQRGFFLVLKDIVQPVLMNNRLFCRRAD
jgi:hypothetical protein